MDVCGQDHGFDRELRANLLAATCTTTNTSTSGEDTADKWEIMPADLTICRHLDGQPVQLGVGAFGTVKPPCFNSLIWKAQCESARWPSLHTFFPPTHVFSKNQDGVSSPALKRLQNVPSTPMTVHHIGA